MLPGCNILLIVADQLRADALGCYGNQICRTPHLDNLAASGAQLTDCMVTQPTCTPSRASILSGCYPSTLRSRMVGCTTPDDPRFLPRLLSNAGYRTASIGKIHLAPQKREPELVAQTQGSNGDYDYYGFQEVDLVNGHGMNCFGPGYTAWLSRRWPDHAQQRAATQPLSPGINNASGSLRTQTWTLPAEAHAGEYIAQQAGAWLRNAAVDPKRQPFFLHVSFPDPHAPFVVPEPYAHMYEPDGMPDPLPPVTYTSDPTPLQLDAYFGACSHLENGRTSDRVIGTPPDNYARYSAADWKAAKAIYYGMITLLDDQIGRILQVLADTRLDDNTIVVFLADHGEYMGDHGFAGKGFLYQSAIQTPLILRGPGIRAGARLAGIASTVDIAPTLLDLIGVPEPAGLNGVSMAKALVAGGPLPRTAALTENDDDFVPMKARALTTSDWKCVWYCGEALGELYHRKNDPHELRNLWQDEAYQQVKTELLQRLLEEVVCALDVSNGRVQAPRAPVPKWLPKMG
ncbi:MAG TPA: sulfatase-like hydrolase/transferase [Firmicutes bacterium]|jgi:arylsulfatase|nr:sulfatase-like hydrolase/transferase [Bacillota bacterium]